MERMQQAAVVNNLLDSRAENKSLSSLMHYLQSILYNNLERTEAIASGLIDPGFMDEIKNIIGRKDIPIYFGKSLRNLKCVLPSGACSREIDIFIQYKAPKRLSVTDANLPRSALPDKEYSSLIDIVTTYEKLIGSLSGYFRELDKIDRFCTVMDPAKPTFRDDFRRILLDDRTWLHVRVTNEGFATDIHLLGNTEQYTKNLQDSLLNWDHDAEIVENITAVFDMWQFLSQPKSPEMSPSLGTEQNITLSEAIVCNICYSSDLAGGTPMPLCLNTDCDAYFHRRCLFEWLSSSSGGRLSAFDVAIGSCPVCNEPATCCKNDS